MQPYVRNGTGKLHIVPPIDGDCSHEDQRRIKKKASWIR